jgi:vacuolar-type H+-ATPase subunit H
MTQTITVKFLRDHYACEEQVDKFINIFGKDAEVVPSLELAEKYGSEFNIHWLANKLLNSDQWKVYDEATDHLVLKTYVEAMASALKTYVEAMASAQKTYKKAIAPARKAYDEATNLVRKAYDEASDLVLKTYNEAIAPAQKTYNEAIAPAQKAYNEASAIAFVKAWNT